MPSNLDFAERIGTEYYAERLIYCSDDNTYESHFVLTTAWACPVALRTVIACERPMTGDELFDFLFGST